MIYRKFDSSSSLILERTTLHAGAAMYEERTIGTDDSREHLARFSYSNHLGSAVLELDETAAIISYEEYHPYGTTSYQAMNATINATAKRYRYTGKERDEESGLYYHGARYYACWLARWTAVDPLEGKYAPQSCYTYCSNNPVMRHDPDGRGDKGRSAMGLAANISLIVAGSPVVACASLTNTAANNANNLFHKQVPLTKAGGSAADHTTHASYITPAIKDHIAAYQQQKAEAAAAHERYMNEDAMVTDVYGNTHIGKRRTVQNIVSNINTEHSVKVGETVANGFFAAQGYAISGGDERVMNLFSIADAGSMYASGYTNAASGNVIPATPAIEPATAPATETPMIEPAPPPPSSGTMTRTADGKYEIMVTPEQAAEMNPAYAVEPVQITSGVKAGAKTSTPNSIYVQTNKEGLIKNIFYYDEKGNVFSREDYIQDSRHIVVIGEVQYNLKNYPHEHQTRMIEGPKGSYPKEQVRILNQQGYPITPWVNAGK